MKEWFEHLIPKEKPIKTNRPTESKVRCKLEMDIEKYLASGGGIQVVPQGATGKDFSYENGKRTVTCALRAKDPKLRKPKPLRINSK